MNQATLVPVSGTHLFVADSGETGLPPVLCLHSLFLDGRMFDGFVAAAAGRFRVIRPDFRGQGRSEPSRDSIISIETCASDIEELLKRLGIASAHVLVSSMGGDVGLRLAAQRPDLVRSLVVLGSSARAEPAEQLGRFRAWVDEVEKTGFTGATLEMTMSIMFGETTRASVAQREMLGLWKERIAALPTTLRPAMSGVIERGSVVDMLPSITAPALVISGDECIARPPDWARELAEGLPNSEFLLLEKIGHSPLLEIPEVVLPRIIAFFCDVERKRTAAR